MPAIQHPGGLKPALQVDTGANEEIIIIVTPAKAGVQWSEYRLLDAGLCRYDDLTNEMT